MEKIQLLLQLQENILNRIRNLYVDKEHITLNIPYEEDIFLIKVLTELISHGRESSSDSDSDTDSTTSDKSGPSNRHLECGLRVIEFNN